MASGVIAEFNIFHNGHKYLIDKAKELSGAVVCVMSGSFVQRGDVAITDKWTRAKTALMCGADLVLELPVCYALNAAPNFASGGVGILNSLGFVDTLVFGSECGDSDAIYNAALLLENEDKSISETVKKLMSEGMAYPAALTRAYDGQIDASLLMSPNDILALEYTRAVIRTASNMKIHPIKRTGASHDDNIVKKNFASASKIRKMLMGGEDISPLIPYDKSVITGSDLYDIKNLDSAITAKLRTMTADELSNINEVTEGLEHRILRAASENYGFADITEAVKNKRYTMSKIRRILLSTLIGFEKDIFSPQPEYIRVLGMNETGAALLKKAKNTCQLPIITKASDFKKNSRQFNLDIRATDIYALCSCNEKKRSAGADFTHSPIVFKGGKL